MKISLTTYFMMLVCFLAGAVPSENYTFTHLTVDNGLSNNWVEDICQDKYGRMWFATNDGINCYNGYDHVIYKHDPDNDLTIQSNIINSIYLDRDMDLWACTANGLARFDYEKGIFCRIPISENVHSVENITQITEELYLVGTRTETYFYDKLSGDVRECLLDGRTISFHSIIVDDGDLIAGSVQDKELLSLTYEDGELRLKNPPVKMQFTISSILKAGNGRYWVGKGKGGMYLVDIKTGAVSKPGEFISDHSSVDALSYDASGRLWVGTADGLYVMETASRSVLKLDCNSGPLSLSHDAVKSLYRDKSGGMWIGTEYGGVNYWSGKNSTFSSLDYSNSFSKRDRIVTAMCMDDDSSFWIGTRHGGLNHYSVTDGCIGTYDIDNIRSVLSVDGLVYVGTRVTGWKILNKRTGKFKSYALPSDVNDFLKLDDGRILVGSLSGLYVYDPVSEDSKKIKGSEGGKGFRILCLHMDSANTLWVGAKEGVRRFVVGENGVLDELEVGRLSDIIQVQCLHESDSSCMWLGTADGLYCYRYPDGSAARVADVPGLNQIIIKGIEEDAKGNLWVSTDNGLTRYDPATGDNRTYYVGDGLQSNQFNAYSSHCSDMYGNLYFGGVGGITWFDPLNVYDNHDTCPPVITGLKLFNVDVRVGDQTGILKKDISITDSIELRHDQSSITLSFACPDYASRGKNRFRYKMEGVDDDWVEADTRRVTYSNLDKGNYSFILAVSNSDGVWAEENAVLHIKVHPVWYRTLLAELFFLLLALSFLAFLAYRLKKHLDTRNAEKIGQLEHRYEEDVRRVRVASYITDPYLLKASDMEFLDSAINHIDANLVNPQFSVEALAAMMNMTRANLHLKVKNMTGISPVELIRKIRVDAACRMIRERKYTLTEIAEKTGFNSASYFTVTFKKVAGCTPGEYLTKFKNL